MTREEFDLLVRRVEEGIGRRSKALRFRVALLAALGFAGLLASLVGVLLIAAFLFVLAWFGDLGGRILFLAIGLVVLLAGGWAVLRVLWVRLPPPEGRAV